MWSPIVINVGRKVPAPSPPPVLPTLTSPSAPGTDQRPSNLIEFLSDLARDPRQALTIVFSVSILIVVFTLCFGASCVAVAMAAKGLHGIPLRYVWPVGTGGASLLTITTIIARAIWKRSRSSRTNAANGGRQSENS